MSLDLAIYFHVQHQLWMEDATRIAYEVFDEEIDDATADHLAWMFEKHKDYDVADNDTWCMVIQKYYIDTKHIG